MKKKNVALGLALVMGFNSFALAQSSRSAVAPIAVDESLIDQSISAQSAEMQRTLKQVEALIRSLETYKESTAEGKQTAFVNSARLLITLLGLSAGLVHVKNVQAQSSIELTLAALAGALSTLLEKYVATNRIDIMDVQKLLQENQKLLADDLALSTGVSAEDAELIAGAISQIGDINNQIKNSADEIQKAIGDGQVDVAILSIATLALNYAAPFLPKRLKEAVANKVPNLVVKAEGVGVMASKRGMQALGGTNVATLLSTLVGITIGKNSHEQLNTILSNLYTTRSNLLAQTTMAKAARN